MASDVYVTPYLDPSQITSGTLAYALGAGKAIVSTPYLHATEVLADGRGILVDFRSERQLAQAVSRILSTPGLKQQLEASAFAYGRETAWPRVGERMMSLLRSVTLRGEAAPVPLAPLTAPCRPARPGHRGRASRGEDSSQSVGRGGQASTAQRHPVIRQLHRLTHAVPAAGAGASALAVYAEACDGAFAQRAAAEQGFEGVACVDDAARAVVLYCQIWRRHRQPWARAAASALLRFVGFMQEPDGRFANFILDWGGEKNLTGPSSRPAGWAWQARAMHALACGVATFGKKLGPSLPRWVSLA